MSSPSTLARFRHRNLGRCGLESLIRQVSLIFAPVLEHSTDDQLGNMVASASAQIEAVAGERLVDPRTGLPAYGKVSCILIGVSARPTQHDVQNQTD